jgi:hypothetical protein
MAQIESRIEAGGSRAAPPDGGQSFALVDALHDGTLIEGQRETLHSMRAGILARFASLSADPAKDGNGSRAKVS